MPGFHVYILNVKSPELSMYIAGCERCAVKPICKCASASSLLGKFHDITKCRQVISFALLVQVNATIINRCEYFCMNDVTEMLVLRNYTVGLNYESVFKHQIQEQLTGTNIE